MSDTEQEECLYSILGVPKHCDIATIRTAYRKKALLCHPDRVSKDKEKVEAEFKKIGRAYEILKNEEKKALYDRTGVVEDRVSDETSMAEVMRSLFREVTAERIDAFQSKYRGSDEEMEDLLDAFAKHNGNFDKLLTCINYDELDEKDEDRLAGRLQEAIDGGVIESTEAWETTKPTEERKKSKAYKARWAKRRKEAAEVKAEQERLKKKKGKKGMEVDVLRQLVREELDARMNQLLSAYGEEGETMPEVDEAELEKMKAKMAKGKLRARQDDEEDETAPAPPPRKKAKPAGKKSSTRKVGKKSGGKKK